MEKTLLSVVGPTAIGKTKLAILLAKHFDSEIISADSRQFFKEMEIGTAVPSQKELSSIRHHFIQHKSILDTYSVGDFERDALQLLKQLFKKKDLIIMVGGSGLYVDSVTKGLDRFPQVDSTIRQNLNHELSVNGIVPLQERLKQLDPLYYSRVDQNNAHRLIRALEICIGTGRAYSSFLNQKRKARPFKVVTLGLEADRQFLYGRINQRVDTMIDKGLVEEARNLEQFKHLNAMQTVGYQEIFDYFEGNCNLEFAISEIKKNSRRFAKRQMTWFKRDKDILWLPYDMELHEILPLVKSKLHES